ncbi:hypothetical protein [Streptomyces carpaticus]|uniref:Uncharacterized protein n=1 Tax=Streptomyces carpaticus TaxID=285558 RepID=A0ABV4ZFQ8_9ACTN
MLDLLVRSRPAVSPPRALFLTDEAGDNTHTSERGATAFSRPVLDGLAARELVPAAMIR